MKTIQIDGSKKPLFSWCPDVDAGALAQITLIAKLPFVEHCALMPDAHFGMQMPIGGVVACNGVVVPNFVGVDIGCGMIAVKTNLDKSHFMNEEVCKKIHHSVSRGVPMGFAHNSQVRTNFLKNRMQDKADYLIDKSGIKDHPPVLKDVEKALWGQLGTLGGGNHFIEINYDEDDIIWIVIHSGSRNIGKKVGDYFNKLAEEMNQIWYSMVQPNFVVVPECEETFPNIGNYKKMVEEARKIPFLPSTSDEGKAYLSWMDFALRFAYLNRAVMMNEVKGVLMHELANVEFEPEINIHHNYATMENHFGRNVWVHRKGATSAKGHETGIIPGSMGTPTFITKGLGNKNSLMSCSHGAGRRMGRKAFNLEANTPEMMEKIKKSMEGVTHTKFGKDTNHKGKETGMLDVSEAPQAYKDIESVMANQVDLTQPLYKLLPIVNWKDAGKACGK